MAPPLAGEARSVEDFLTSVKQSLVIMCALLALAAAVFCLDWNFFLLTGHFKPVQIIETLHGPVAVAGIEKNGLRISDNRLLNIPGAATLDLPPAISRDIMKHGVEIAPDGTILALLRVHHWCGNDPVRVHFARLELASVLLLIREDNDRVTDYGVSPGISMMEVPYAELKDIYSAGKTAPVTP